MSDHVELLLVEDDEGYSFLTLQMIEIENVARKVDLARDAVEAFELLDNGVSRPSLILLDINLPGLSGHEFLERLRSHPSYGLTPVVILTESSAEEDVRRSYALGANCYVRKPHAPDEFRRFLKSIQEFWFQTAELPPPPAAPA